MGDRIRGTEVS